MTDQKDDLLPKPAPAKVKLWPFSAFDRPDGERAWAGGHWGNVSATMPHATEYTRSDLAETNLSKVTRVEVIDNKGRAYTKYNVESVYYQLQDDGKTLKLFVQYNQEEDIQND